MPASSQTSRSKIRKWASRWERKTRFVSWMERVNFQPCAAYSVSCFVSAFSLRLPLKQPVRKGTTMYCFISLLLG